MDNQVSEMRETGLQEKGHGTPDGKRSSAGVKDPNPASHKGGMTLPILMMAGFFVVAQLMGVAASPQYIEEEVQAFGEETDSSSHVIFYVVFLMIFSAGVLYLAKKGLDWMIQIIFLLAMSATIWYAIFPLLAIFMPSLTAQAIAFIPALFMLGLLYYYPEWYVIDAAGVMGSAGVCAILGVSFSPFPLMMLLIALAVYDAIAVYRTKHMIDLADSVTELRLPVLLVVPKRLPFSYLKQKGLKEQLDSGEEREAMYMGLGDIVIPGSLAVSAASFLTADRVGDGELFGTPGRYAVALFTVLGGLIGFIALMYLVMKGKPHAGLPLLNTGAILGYVLSALIIFGELGLKIQW